MLPATTKRAKNYTFLLVDEKTGLFYPTEPGIFDVDWDTYKRTDALNSSSMKSMARSMLHFKTEKEEPPKPPTVFMEMGTAFHYAALEPERFRSNIVVDLPINKNRKDYKAWRSKQDGKLVLAKKYVEAAMRMAKKLHQKKCAAFLLRSGYPEKTIFWKDPEFGFWCKARIDWIPEHIPGTIVDLKKTDNASLYGFRKKIRNYNYYWQAHWYLKGMTEATGIVHDQFFWVAWEPEPPYEGNVFKADPDEILRAEEQVVYFLYHYAQALETGEYPGYDDAIIFMNDNERYERY